MLTPPGNMPMQPMAQPAPPMQAPMPPAMMTRNNAGRRRGFGDYLENMLDRPMMAADNMGDFDVFTGQPVVQMRRGGSVSDYNSKAFSDYVASKSNTFAPTVRGATPGRAVKTHDEIMASIRGGSSPNDDKPVVVEDPLDAFGGAGPDIASDPDYVSDGVGFKYDPVVSGGTGTSGLPPIPLNEIVVTAPSESSGSGMQFGDQPAAGLPQDPDFYDPRRGTGRSGFSDPLDPFGGSGDPVNQGIASIDSGVGGGRGAGPGGILVTGGTNLPSEDDMTIRDRINKMIQDFKAVPGNIANDMKMAMAAGLFGSRNQRYKNLLDAGYTPEQANKFLDDSEATMKKMMDEQRRLSDQDGDDEKVVNPCQPGYVLDPATNICVPESEVAGSEGGDSVSLNRARDDEFAELDDIMKIIEKPANMKAGGMAGLNRAADNFLSAMGK